MPGVTDRRSHWGHYVCLKLSNRTRFVSTFKLQSFSTRWQVDWCTLAVTCLWLCFSLFSFCDIQAEAQLHAQENPMSSCPLPPFLLNAFHTLRQLSFVCLFACFDMFACLFLVCDIFKRNSCPLPRFLPYAFHCLVLAHCDKFLPFASFVCLFAKINLN